MKKICALIMCMTVCGAALVAQTEADFETRPFGNNVVVIKFKGPGEQITIPATIGGKPVTGINYRAFARSEVVSVTIPTSVTYIGEEAFNECRSLTSVIIPTSVTHIGEEAFSYCSNLTTVTIQEGVTNIGEGAFSFCTRLTSITIPASVVSIGKSALFLSSLKPEIRADIEKRFGIEAFEWW
jgi:hypothetical protein